MTNPIEAVTSATHALALGEVTSASVGAMDDAALIALQAALDEHRRSLDALASLAAGEIARRSTRELGHAGLAQSHGYRSPEEFIQSVSGASRAEAGKLVKVGSMLVGVAAGVGAAPDWQQPLTIALEHGGITVGAADAILRGLGAPDSAVPPPLIRLAAEQLVAAAQALDVDTLFRRARELRDELDERGIASREKERHDLRYFRAARRRDGMVAGSFLLDQEDGALVLSALDTALSPRRGGPRFVDAAAQAEADALLADPRTNDQLAADAVMALIRLAIDTDDRPTYRHRRPAVRVIVTEDSIRRRGHGTIEGMPDPVAFPTVERHLCDTGILGIKFAAGQVIDLGRDQRLFSERQRIAMAVRDGGCLFPDCNRPPSQCEAHHINQWHRDAGRTDLADGVLLCRFHHLLLHNNGWKIRRDHTGYVLLPPRSIDPLQQPRVLTSRTRPVRHLAAVT